MAASIRGSASVRRVGMIACWVLGVDGPLMAIALPWFTCRVSCKPAKAWADRPSDHEGAMKKSRFMDDQMVCILRKADQKIRLI